MTLLRLVGALACASLLMLGCDEETGGETDAGMTASDAGGGDTDAGGGDMDAGGGDTDAGGGDTDAGGGDTDAGGGDTDAGDTDAGPGGASMEAMTFCTDYESICGFGADRHADRDACLAAFDGYAMMRQMCVTTHLGLADTTGMTGLHCPHATGMAPCN